MFFYITIEIEQYKKKQIILEQEQKLKLNKKKNIK